MEENSSWSGWIIFLIIVVAAALVYCLYRMGRKDGRPEAEDRQPLRRALPDKELAARAGQASFPADRAHMAALKEETLENGETRTVLSIPAPLAPVKVAVLPLIKKDGLPEVAQKIMDDLKYDFNCQYDEKDSIGKRYRRQDAIGTPFCVTVDHDSLADGCVTIRHRDTMAQERVKIEDLRSIIDREVSMTSLLKKLK